MLYWTLKVVLTPMVRVGFRVRVEGQEHIPARGPVIFAANHRSFLDSVFLPLAIGRRRLTFVAKAEYFEQRRSAWFFRAIGQIPIARSGGSASESALIAATEVLDRGGAFGIYPEGTRTRDGLTHRGHTGVARLARSTGAPIVPVGLVGTDEAQPTNAKLPRLFRRVTIRFGEPLTVPPPPPAGLVAPREPHPPTPTPPRLFRRVTIRFGEPLTVPRAGDEPEG